ncbi:hypothetical protein BDF20DRAFT_865263, partial [Mycotypha africana]|uniref:uncharacterized protein n=1 Tax=Mycotypha africana TaxID=64632 RepID=UPI0023011058
MSMAHGIGQVVRDAIHPADVLQKLTTGENKRGRPFLANYDTITLFNDTGFVGPQGPILFNKEGDIMIGNFNIFNLQNGTQVSIGSVVGGKFELSTSPVYYDGTNTPPLGQPPITVLEAGLSTPIAKTTATITIISLLAAFFILFTIVLKRHHLVFKYASVSFCIIELFGFILSYLSILLIFKSSMCLVTCYLLPIFFYLAYSIIICTMLARNYQVYKTMNNIFANGVCMTDAELLRLISYVFLLNSTVLVLWLLSTTVELSEVSVSSTNTIFIKTCNYYHDPNSLEGERQHQNYFNHSFFVVIMSIIAGIELGMCVFMTMRTKTFGGYSKYSEHKQLGLSVYNVFFSAMIGFIIFFMPTNDFYTRHYVTAMTILWATTFSMIILFFPKIYKLLKSYKDNSSQNNKVHQYQLTGKEHGRDSVHDKRYSNGKHTTQKDVDKTLMTMNQFLAIDHLFLPIDRKEHKLDNFEYENNNVTIDDDTAARSVTMVGSSCSSINVKEYETEDTQSIAETINYQNAGRKLHVISFEDVLPVQCVFKLFPSLLARWEMRRIVLYPQLRSFLYYSSV